MKFIDLWNKCHTDCSKEIEKPLTLLIERIATDEKDAMEKLTGEFTKYLKDGEKILDNLRNLCDGSGIIIKRLEYKKASIKEKVKNAKNLKKDFSNPKSNRNFPAASHLSNEEPENLIYKFGNNNNNSKGGRRRVSKKRPTRTVKRSHRK
jgi:hypothetical protein